MRFLECPTSTARLALLLILALLACSEREDPLRDFGLIPGIVDSLHTQTIPSSNLDTFYQTARNAGGRLWVGNELVAGGDVAEAKALLRFQAANVPPQAAVLTDTLILHCDLRGDYGDPALQNIEVQRILSNAWFTNQGQEWPFTDHQGLNPPIVTQVGACADSPSTEMRVVLPANLVGGWAASPDSNFGLALVAEGSGGFKRFLATGSLAPLLGVRYRVGTDPDADTTSIRLPLTDHLTLTRLSPTIENGLPTGDEDFALAGGPFDFRSVVGFDLSSLPVDASLNRLRLVLHLSPRYTSVGEDSTINITVQSIVDIPGENLDASPTVGFSSTVSARATVKVAADTTLTIDVSSVRRHIETGILIKADQEFPDLDQFGWITREGAAAERPRLEVLYSVPAKIRF